MTLRATQMQNAKWGHFFNIMTTVTVSYFSLSDSYTVTASIGSY